MKNLTSMLIVSFTLGCASVHDVRKINPGETKDQVIQQLGEPDLTEFSGNSSMFYYTVQKGGKAWQVALAPLTCGLNLLFTQKYEIVFVDDKVNAVTPVEGGSRGLAAIGAIFRGVGQGMSGSGSRTSTCTTTNTGYSEQTECR